MSTTTGIEREIKLLSRQELSAEVVRAIALEQGFQVGAMRRVHQLDTYLDTARQDLRAAGLALRCRARDGGASVCVKGRPLLAGGVLEREEIEATWPLATLPRRSADLPDAIRHRIEPFLLDRELLPVLALTTMRSSQKLRDGRSTMAGELCIDQVLVGRSDDERAQAFTEVELELEVGAIGPLQMLAQELGERLLLTQSPIDKLQRARTLTGETTIDAAEPDGITLQMPARDAAFLLCRRLFADVQRHEPGARLQDVEALHEMRVATRRLRSALRLFAPLFGEARLDSIREWARDLGQALGPVRDLDVLLESVRDARAELAPGLQPPIDELVEQLERRRRVEQQRLLQWLGAGERLARTRAEQEFLAAGAGGRGAGIELRLVAPGLLLRALRKLQVQVRRLGSEPTSEQLHALRIAAKRLRHAAELLGPAYGRRVASLVRRTTKLQQRLGAITDAHTAMLQLEAILLDEVAKPSAGAVLAARELIAHYAAVAARERPRFAGAWRKFRRGRFRRRLRRELLAPW